MNSRKRIALALLFIFSTLSFPITDAAGISLFQAQLSEEIPNHADGVHFPHLDKIVETNHFPHPEIQPESFKGHFVANELFATRHADDIHTPPPNG